MALKINHRARSTKIIIVIQLFLLSYLLYSLTKNVYNSFAVDKIINNFEEENLIIAEENKRLNEDYLYYTSEEYLDKIAKQTLGQVNQGEIMIVLTDEYSKSEINEELGEGLASYQEDSNVDAWWNFFFGS